MHNYRLTLRLRIMGADLKDLPGDHMVVGRTTSPPEWSRFGRDMALQSSGKFVIETVTGPRAPDEGDDMTTDSSDWNQLLDGGLRDVELCVDADGFTLALGASDYAIPVTIELMPERIE